ncbi:hypothetical protein JG687_00008296 [Phytophthora cactorum]|uniref:Uncharacterized protein n=1 Tax=Phytophthora cactorum TaxID=29920 RepID=A0A8T1UCQ4_9STRA|nr:hypothetical protein JG687_00008296 [Phytophthora cactorum]
MTQLASIGAMTRVMWGGRHRCIRSHCMAFDSTPGPPMSILPRSLDGVTSYRAVMVGDFTEGLMSKVSKIHQIRSKEHFRDDGACYGEAIDIDQESIRGRSDAWNVGCLDDEQTILERRIGLTDAEMPAMTDNTL